MKNNLKKILAVVLSVLMVCTMFGFMAFADETVTTDTTTAVTSDATDSNLSNWLSIATTVLPLVLIAVVFYFLLIRPQKKQEKETQTMRNSISVGDTVTTIGGITGTVLQIKETEEIFILETGADRNRISVRKWAIQSKDKAAE